VAHCGEPKCQESATAIVQLRFGTGPVEVGFAACDGHLREMLGVLLQVIAQARAHTIHVTMDNYK
jgi:hypothetical protein